MLQQNTITMAVLRAGLKREEFSAKRVCVACDKVRWPRKKYNKAVGIRRDVGTMQIVERRVPCTN